MVFNYKFPSFDESVLENGLRLILIPDHEQEGLVIAAQFPFGRFCDPVSKEGLSEMTIALVQKGTHELTSEQFYERMEFSGATLFTEVGEEHTGIGIRMMSRSKDEIIPLFFDMLRNPKLDSAEYKRLQKEMVTSLQAEAVEPSVIANRHFYVELVGKEHPAGRFHSIDTIKNISLQDVKEFFTRRISPKNAVLVVAGDFEVQEFKNSYLKKITEWKNDSTNDSCFASRVLMKKGAYRLVDKPDLTQTTVVIGHSSSGELAPERNCVALANYILGAGNFSSRLMSSIRSKVGRTYGISSQITAERDFGAFTITTSTQNNQLGAVVDAILDEFTTFWNQGVTGDELEKAKRFAIGNMAFQLEGIGNVAEKILWLRFYSYSNSFIEQFDKMINDISLDQINSTIKRMFSPESLNIVAVGKKNEIASQLQKYGDFKQFHFREKV